MIICKPNLDTSSKHQILLTSYKLAHNAIIKVALTLDIVVVTYNFN
jgi:hypothetical protein